jgi:hypothetical protein
VERGERVGRARRRRKRTRLKILLALVIAVVVGLGGLFGYGVLRGIFGNDPPSALDGYLDGGGITYSFPGEQTSVRLPEDPRFQTSTATVGGITVVISSALVERATYEMNFYKYEAGVLRQGDPVSIRRALEGGSNSAATAVGLSIQRTDDAPLDGRPARSVHGTVKGDQADLVMVYAKGNIYAMFVHTKQGSTAVLKKFEESFQP